MLEPDYLVCLECDTPTYVFEWSGGVVLEAACPACGNDDPSLFCTEDELEEMTPGLDEEAAEDDVE